MENFNSPLDCEAHNLALLQLVNCGCGLKNFTKLYAVDSYSLLVVFGIVVYLVKRSSIIYCKLAEFVCFKRCLFYQRNVLQK